MLSLAKGAFHLAMARDIYVISDGKYRMSHAELREHAELVINAIKEMDPFAFSAKQVGEFAGTEAAKMVHTIFLGKIIAVVSKVNMASKARFLVKKLDQVTHAAQTERAVAVTAEGFVVHAAQDARAGLALSEINSASQAEKRVAQAAAALAQEGAAVPNSTAAAGELLCPIKSKARSLATIDREADILNYIKKPLDNLIQKSNNIKFIGDDVLDVSHIFSAKHVERKILDMGMTAEEVAAECVKLIDTVDQAGLLAPGINNIRTTINGIPFDVRFFVQNNTLMSFNGFVGNSGRVVKSLVKIEGGKIWKTV